MNRITTKYEVINAMNVKNWGVGMLCPKATCKVFKRGIVLLEGAE